MAWTSSPDYVGINLASKPDQTAYFTEAAPISKQAWDSLKERNNKVPTHDPYTNPDTHIYYSCECGEVFDPGTKSFAALNNAASHTGWIISWRKNGQGYDAFCPKCAEKE